MNFSMAGKYRDKEFCNNRTHFLYKIQTSTNNIGYELLAIKKCGKNQNSNISTSISFLPTYTFHIKQMAVMRNYISDYDILARQ